MPSSNTTPDLPIWPTGIARFAGRAQRRSSCAVSSAPVMTSGSCSSAPGDSRLMSRLDRRPSEPAVAALAARERGLVA
jgi:hypothetical protein